MNENIKKPTIVDVAKKAGVSFATVSRVINKSGYVSKEKADLINRTIAELNYHQNKLARSLNTKRTNLVALLIGDITNPYYPQLTLGVEETANKFDYRVILCNTNGDPVKEKRYINDLVGMQIDGLIFAQSRVEKEYYSKLVKLNIPIVILDEQIPIPNCDRILFNHRKGALDITEYLIKSGYKRIAHITGPINLLTAQERINGYLDALKSHSIKPIHQLIKNSEYTIESGKQAMEMILTLKDPPDAVFAANDLIAIGAMEAIKSKGLKIPTDIAVAGFDDITFARITEPKLTTVCQPINQMGGLAMRVLIDRLNNSYDSVEPRTITLQPSIAIREST